MQAGPGSGHRSSQLACGSKRPRDSLTQCYLLHCFSPEVFNSSFPLAHKVFVSWSILAVVGAVCESLQHYGEKCLQGAWLKKKITSSCLSHGIKHIR